MKQRLYSARRPMASSLPVHAREVAQEGKVDLAGAGELEDRYEETKDERASREGGGPHARADRRVDALLERRGQLQEHLRGASRPDQGVVVHGEPGKDDKDTDEHPAQEHRDQGNGGRGAQGGEEVPGRSGSRTGRRRAKTGRRSPAPRACRGPASAREASRKIRVVKAQGLMPSMSPAAITGKTARAAATGVPAGTATAGAESVGAPRDSRTPGSFSRITLSPWSRAAPARSAGMAVSC